MNTLLQEDEFRILVDFLDGTAPATKGPLGGRGEGDGQGWPIDGDPLACLPERPIGQAVRLEPWVH